jgi:hypothetical protein
LAEGTELDEEGLPTAPTAAQGDGIAAGRSPLSDDGKPDAVLHLRYRKLQGLAGSERNFRENIDRKPCDRDPHQIVREKLQHLGVNNASRLQRQIGRGTLGGNYWKDRIDRDRHFQVSLSRKR